MIVRMVFFGLLVLLASTLSAQNEPPQVDQIQMTVNASEEKIAVDYRVNDQEGDQISVYLLISMDGHHFERPPDGLSGDLGEGVASGNNQIEWAYPSTVDPRALSYRLAVWDDHPINVEALVNQVDSQRMERRLRAFEGVRHYSQNPQGLSDMRDTIQAHFEAANLHTYSQLFNFQGTEGVNLIGKKAGLRDAQNVWIMDGHYDSVSGSPGADDNASAVVGMLECLEILSDVPCKETINFIGFDFEEQGLVGSNRYATSGILDYEEVQGVFNFEMIGYYSEEPNSQTLPFGFSQLFPEAAQEVESQEFRGNFLINVGNGASADLIGRLEAAAETYVPALRVISLTVPGNGGIVPDLRRSDHASFWDQGYPALMLTDGANFRNTNYHEPSDTAGTLNFTFMQRVTQATLAALVEAAQPVNGRTYEIESPVSFQHAHLSPEAALKVYPNPSSERLNVSIEKGGNYLYTVGIYDMQGVPLREMQMFGKEQRQIDIHNVPPGRYFVIASYMENNLGTELIIQRN